MGLLEIPVMGRGRKGGRKGGREGGREVTAAQSC